MPLDKVDERRCVESLAQCVAPEVLSPDAVERKTSDLRSFSLTGQSGTSKKGGAMAGQPRLARSTFLQTSAACGCREHQPGSWRGTMYLPTHRIPATA